MVSKSSSRRHSNLFSPIDLHRAQSTLPDLPTGIMSPPLQTQLFFSAERGSQQDQRKLFKKPGGTTHPTIANRHQHLLVASGRDLSRTSSHTTSSSHTVTPPLSHFNTFARANATRRVDLIVQMGLVAQRSQALEASDDLASAGSRHTLFKYNRLSPGTKSTNRDVENRMS